MELSKCSYLSLNESFLQLSVLEASLSREPDLNGPQNRTAYLGCDGGGDSEHLEYERAMMTIGRKQD